MMTLMKIFLSPFLVKKSPIFKQCLCTYHMSHAKNIANDDKSFAIKNTNKDKLFMELDTLPPSRILRVLKNNKKSINGSHIVLAMTKLYSQRKLSNQDISKFWKSADIMEMCSVVDLNVHKLSVSESVKLLIMFRKMKAPGSMTVVNSLLKHIIDSVKGLALVDFGDVSRTLNQMLESSSTKDLHNTLKRKFVHKVATEFDPDNIEHLDSALSFTVQLDNNKLLKLFVNELNNYKGEISLHHAISIFQSLSLMKQYPPGWLNVLQRIQNILIEQVERLTTNQIIFLLYRMSEKCKMQKNEEFYNEKLCDLLVKKIVTDDGGFEAAVNALSNLTLGHIGFVSKELLNYACAAYFERINLSKEGDQPDFFKLLALITSLAEIKHKTIFFDEIKDSVLNNELLLHSSYKCLCYLALHLIILDCYPSELLTKLFNDKSSHIDKTWGLIFCKVYQKIKTNANYKGPLPSELQLAALKELHYQRYLHQKKKNDNKILYYLEEGMGAPIYVKSNISSKLFHLIDYAVAFSKDGFPLPINTATNINEKPNSIEYVEDLEVPQGSQIVLILLTPRYWYSRNTKEVYSTYLCTVETLEALGYPVVCINETVWDKTPIEEKTAMLMDKIRSKLAHD